MLNFLQNPVIRVLGISLILYFALFNDKDNPKSLGHRLSVENIKKNVNEANNKGHFIVENINRAKNISNNKELAKDSIKRPLKPVQPIKRGDINNKKNINYAILKDVKIGDGNQILLCNDSATISYQIHLDNNGKIISLENINIIIGSNLIPYIEQNIIGMKLNGIRKINISRNSTNIDEDLSKLITDSKSNLQIIVTLNSLNKAPNNKEECF